MAARQSGTIWYDDSNNESLIVVGPGGTPLGSTAIPAGTNNIGDVDVLTLPALPVGTNNIGRVGASVVEIAGTVNGANTIEAAGDYAALDVFSQAVSAGTGVSWLFSSIARETGGSGTITRALIMSTAETMTARVRLWLFNAAPTTATEMDDNAAFLLDEDDYTKLVGWIDFPSFERAGAAGEVAVALNDTVRLAFKCAADANLRGITHFLDAEANEAAGMTVHIRLQATLD